MSEQTQLVVDEKKKKEKKQMVAGGIFFTLLILFWIIFNFLVGLILTLIGVVITIKLLKKKPEIQKFAPVIFVILVVFILGVIFIPAMQSDKDFKGERDKILTGNSQNYSYLTETGTLERNIELGALKVLGHETEIRKIKIDNGELWIDYVASENLTKNLTRRRIWIDTKDLVRELSTIVDPNINAIISESHLVLVDQYGKESLSRVALITINRETWEKINWDNFLTDNLPDVADGYWLHPALKD